MPSFLKRFFPAERELYVTEFGHSRLEQKRTVGPRTREQYILHFVVRGYSDFSGFRAEAGEAFLISRGMCHSFTTSEEYEQYWIGFGGSAAERIFASFGLSVEPHQLFRVEHADFAEELFADARGVLKFKDAESSEAVAVSVLLALLPQLSASQSSNTYKSTDYVERAMRYMQINYVHRISLAKIASEVHITEKYMYRLFVERLGITPRQYLLGVRMKKAHELLSGSDLSVKEVAASVGYSSIPSFSRAFAEHFGTPPSAVKQKKTKREDL